MTAAQTDAAHDDGDMDTLTVAVAEELRVHMTRKRITGRELARRLNVSSQWISQRTRGVVPIDTRDMQRLASALQMTPAELLSDAIQRVSGAPARPSNQW